MRYIESFSYGTELWSRYGIEDIYSTNHSAQIAQPIRMLGRHGTGLYHSSSAMWSRQSKTYHTFCSIYRGLSHLVVWHILSGGNTLFQVDIQIHRNVGIDNMMFPELILRQFYRRRRCKNTGPIKPSLAITSVELFLKFRVKLETEAQIRINQEQYGCTLL